ncbi:MAG: hypothetical protein HXY41_08120 [Chloroflexi bacterium]|nr:hypothetical protein [Chloroflexota bacterium]
MFWLKKIALLLPLLLAACAIGDTGNPTPAPPVTLMPPSEITFQGSCTATRELEMWLQVTTRLATDFLAAMNNAAAMNRADMREAVFTMAALRDSAHQATTPDCAVDAEILLSDAMNKAVLAFQAVVNGDRPDLGNTVAEVNDQIEQVIAIQNELILRMETQIRESLVTASP